MTSGGNINEEFCLSLNFHIIGAYAFFPGLKITASLSARWIARLAMS
jgi:hypothetical protein